MELCKVQWPEPTDFRLVQDFMSSSWFLSCKLCGVLWAFSYVMNKHLREEGIHLVKQYHQCHQPEVEDKAWTAHYG